MKNKKRENWLVIKISAFWLGVFALVSAIVAIWLLWAINKELRVDLGVCQKLKSAEIKIEEVK